MRNRQATQLLSELSHAGRRGAELPSSDVPDWPIDVLIPREAIADAPLKLPELAEPDVPEPAKVATLSEATFTPPRSGLTVTS